MKYIITKYGVIIYLTTLVLLMVLPFGKIGLHNPISFKAYSGLGDYVAHLVVYLPWMFCGGWICKIRLKSTTWFLIGVLFVAGLELIQLSLPYRGFNIFDILVGEIGICVSYCILTLYNRFRSIQQDRNHPI